MGFPAWLVKYSKQSTVRDAHSHTPTRTVYHTLWEKHSRTLWLTSAAGWELPVGQSENRCGNCLIFLPPFSMSSFAYFPHQQVRDSRVEPVLTHGSKGLHVSAYVKQWACVSLPADCVRVKAEANRACWRCTTAQWLWWGEPLCSATPPAAAGCSGGGSAPRPAAPPCPLSPGRRHTHTHKQKQKKKAVAQMAVAGTGEERLVQRRKLAGAREECAGS